MSAGKHTPGPWWFAADAPDTYAVGAGDIEIAGGLRRDNARLIAAAPRVSAAAARALEYLAANYSDADMPDILPELRAALAAAGVTP